MEEKQICIPGAAGNLYLTQDSFCSDAFMRFTVTLTLRIRESILKQAVNDLMSRFSYLAAGVEMDGQVARLVRQDTEVPVFTEDSSTYKNAIPGSPECGGYLFRFSVSHKTIYVDWHMAICDERGMAEFVKSVLFRYLQLCGYPVCNDGSIKECGYTASPSEGIDPYLRLEDITALRPAWYMDAKAFSVPLSAENNTQKHIFQVRLPLSRVKNPVLQYLNEPEAFLCPMFSHALHEAYADDIQQGEYIVARIRENLRPHFPTASLRTFYAPLSLAYNRKLTEYPLTTILMSQKKLIDAQLRSDALAYSAKRLVSGKTDMEGTATFSVFNMGNPVMPETLHQYIVEFSPVSSSSMYAYSLSLISFKGELVVNISSEDSDRRVPFRFVELLNQYDVYAFVSDEYSYDRLEYRP